MSTTAQAPERNDFSAAAIFPVLWVLVSYFFLPHMFIGAVVDAFNRIKSHQDGSGFMSSEQQQWVASYRHILRQKPKLIMRAPTDTPDRALVFRTPILALALAIARALPLATAPPCPPP